MDLSENFRVELSVLLSCPCLVRSFSKQDNLNIIGYANFFALLGFILPSFVLRMGIASFAYLGFLLGHC